MLQRDIEAVVLVLGDTWLKNYKNYLQPKIHTSGLLDGLISIHFGEDSKGNDRRFLPDSTTVENKYFCHSMLSIFTL